MMQRKYGNRKVDVDGMTFDSQAEAIRYRELLLLEQAGHIIDLRVHPSFVLVPAFIDHQGRRVRAITYTADFDYYDCARRCRVVEDVKGLRTQAFSIKWKLAQYVHREADWAWEIVQR